ncbi:GGDEF domain-containing protein [Kineococcus gynurae]|uniref:GGDEF domain-containing protein n=1 Tax=Kineococcus gynurae TaxID=452979 RepID=A0ABV5LX65_9ACTN
MDQDEYRGLVENSPMAIFVVREGLVVWANPAAETLSGSAVGRAFVELLEEDDRDDAADVLDRAARGGGGVAEWRLRRPEGDADPLVLEVLLGVTEVDGIPSVSLACWDVSGHVERQRDLSYRATHDRLTGLPNRSLLEDRWRLLRSRSARGGRPPLVVFCDVDGLKQVNDTYGHAAGDAALVGVAQVLAATARAGDTVARFGGDEFVVLAENPGDSGAEALTARLAQALADVVVGVGEDRQVRVRSSIGSVVDDPALPPVQVLAQADARMYRRKRGEQD